MSEQKTHKCDHADKCNKRLCPCRILHAPVTWIENGKRMCCKRASQCYDHGIQVVCVEVKEGGAK